ncbi:histidine kinase [Flavobacterium sp. FBOR7N2.3]|uniref:Histidine kinase n=1 Tax=Flavobacterium magnesitis TaxID=3138077 RepID=A0ABV4TQT8_9FLAO
MKTFQKFIFLSISLFVVIGIFKLSAGKPFFEEFSLDVYGFLAIMQFIFPTVAYVYFYEKRIIHKKIDLKKVGIEKTFLLTYGLVFVISYVFSFLLIYFATGKIEYEYSFVSATAFNNFLFIAIALNMHNKFNVIPVFKLNEKPVFYIKSFFFSILGVCVCLLVIFALATLQFDKKLEVPSTQFIIDCILFAVMAVSIAFSISFTLNKINLFRKSILLPIIVTTIITFWIIKLLGYPRDYFRVLITEYSLEQITFFLSFAIVMIPIARSKRNFKIKKLTSDFSKKEAEYLQLKNQINPHFLFNNLNVLISFIELEPKKAVDFGHHLSNVYRHYLKNQIEDFVSLQGEINFITEYLSIYKAKFEKGFFFKMPEIIAENQYILPNCLQELVDNIFKHNVVSEEIPLEIEIFIENNTLVIQNTMNKKEIEIVSNFGLENIKKRYLLLTNTSIEIIETEIHFTVKIPILELES